MVTLVQCYDQNFAIPAFYDSWLVLVCRRRVGGADILEDFGDRKNIVRFQDVMIVPAAGGREVDGLDGIAPYGGLAPALFGPTVDGWMVMAFYTTAYRSLGTIVASYFEGEAVVCDTLIVNELQQFLLLANPNQDG